MSRRARDRRRGSGELTTRPPSSPVNLLILTIVGVLGISAAAAAMMGSGYDSVTPHGQLLGDLQRVAAAQERHHARTGRFAEWVRTLAVEGSPEIRLTILHGDHDDWEAVATHPVGLTCTQAGRFENGVVRLDPPACYTLDP